MITDPIYLERVGKYADLARRYADAPFARREGSSIEPELSRLEELLAAEPPRGEKSPGLWTPRPKGLHPRSLAERKALDLIEAAAFPVTDVELFGTFLLLGVPVYTGYSGHAWFAIWLVSTSKLIWVNSWSADWGQSGMGTLSFSSLRYGCYAVL